MSHIDDFNDNGEVVFRNRILGTSGGFNDALGLFRAGRATVTQLIRQPQPAPDGNGTFVDFSVSRIDDTSQVAFLGFLRGTSKGSADDTGIFLTNGGRVMQLVREGQLVPDGNGMFSGEPLFDSGFIRRLAMNNEGQLAFMAGISNTRGGANDDRGVFLVDGTIISQLLRKGDPAPDGNGTFDDFDLNGGIYLNEDGQVAFAATLANTSGGTDDDIGIFLVDGSTVIQLVREGQRAPSGGTFFGLNMNRSSALAEDGQVAFLSGVTDDLGTVAFGIFLAGPKGIIEVIREGSHLEGSTVARLAFVFPPSHFSVNDLRRRFNRCGQVVYRATLSDGREGIFLFSPRPSENAKACKER